MMMFISGLQVFHCFYKHLEKHEVTRVRDILSQAQKYIQIKDATWNAVDRSSKGEDKGEKSNPQSAFQKKNQNCASRVINK